jgi:diacylglycerol O-acyltransferase
MANPDRLSGLDASFLSLERSGAHMHVGSVLVFEGSPPPYDELVAKLEQRLHLVPRYRQKLAWPPLAQSRPVWIDDPHFNARYHVRHTALPAPGGEEELKALAGRVFAQGLDRSKPLWELWMVDRVGDDAFAVISKTHHALVDGVSGVDISTVLFDLEPDPPEPDPAPPWAPRPEPSGASLVADVVAERAGTPLDAARGVYAAVRHPERAVAGGGKAVGGLASMAAAGLGGAPPSPLNVRIGPHRRFTWVDADLVQFKAIKGALGGTVNDVVLAAVTGALRAFVIRRGRDPEGMELKAMVPVSVRADAERGALGNRVAAMYAPLPVYAADPVERFRIVHEAMGGLKESGQAVGAEVLTRLAGFAAPTVLDQAARLQTRQRFFNLVVTNVPGPQFPLYLHGRRLRSFYPQVPLTLNTALGIAIMSYDGRLGFGLLGDYDALPELDDVAEDLEGAIAELAAAAGVTPTGSKRRRPAARRRKPAATT